MKQILVLFLLIAGYFITTFWTFIFAFSTIIIVYEDSYIYTTFVLKLFFVLFFVLFFWYLILLL